MSIPVEVFEAWLAIPRTECPPHHYRLLGLTPFEADPGRIEAAAAVRRGQLQPHLAGPHAPLAHRLAEALELARRTLLVPDAKRFYDEQLRRILPAVGGAGAGAWGSAAGAGVPGAVPGSAAGSFPGPAAGGLPGGGANPFPGQSAGGFPSDDLGPGLPQLGLPLLPQPGTAGVPPSVPPPSTVGLPPWVWGAIGVVPVAALGAMFLLSGPSRKPAPKPVEEVARVVPKPTAAPPAGADPLAPSAPASPAKPAIPAAPKSDPAAMPAPASNEESPAAEPEPPNEESAPPTPRPPRTMPAEAVRLPGTDALAQVAMPRDVVTGSRWVRTPAGWTADGAPLKDQLLRLQLPLPQEFTVRLLATVGTDTGPVRLLFAGTPGRPAFEVTLAPDGGLRLSEPGPARPRITSAALDEDAPAALLGSNDNGSEPMFDFPGSGGLEPGSEQVVSLRLTYRAGRIVLEAGGNSLLDGEFDWFRLRLPEDRLGRIDANGWGLLAEGPITVHALRVETLEVVPREQVPAGAEIAAARNAGREITERFATVRTPEGKREIFDWVKERRPEGKLPAAEAYVRAMTLRDWAIELGDGPVALQATNSLVRRFDLPERQEKATVLRKLADKVPPEQLGDAASACGVGFAEALETEDYPAADDFLKGLKRCVERAKIGYARPILDRNSTRLAERQASYAATAAARDALAVPGAAADPAAELAVGLHHGLIREDWGRALPHLSRCGDPAWEEVARAERGASASVTDRLRRADLWDKLAEQVPAERRDRVRRYAARLRLTAVDALEGDDKEAALKRLRQAGPLTLAPEQAADMVRFQDKQYLFVAERMQWDDAEAWCRLRGGHLASVRNATEASFVQWYAGNFAGRANFWLGGRTNEGGTDWEWADGGKLNFALWTERPSTSAELRLQGTWHPRGGLVWKPFKQSDAVGFLVQWPATEKEAP